MKYDLFARLYSEALEYNDMEMYVSERGWQAWMDEYYNEDVPGTVGEILLHIYELAHMDFRKMRESQSINRAKFSRKYNYPVSTFQSWEQDGKDAPQGPKMLIAYTIFNDNYEK